MNLRVSGLTRRYLPGAAAVDRASFDLTEGSRTGIQGPSGSGKSTLLRLLAGLEHPDEGQVELDGQVVSRPGWVLNPHLRGMGMVFQNPALWPHMTVTQNILFGLGRLLPAERKLRVDKVLEQCGLVELAQRYPEQLSGGQAHRVALARALAPQPPILLLDEPLAHLDADSKDELLGLLRRAAAQVSILVYVSHDRQEIDKVCERVWRLNNGKLDQGSGISEEAQPV